VRPTGVYAEEAHLSRGKRASVGEINHTTLLGKWQQSIRKQPIENSSDFVEQFITFASAHFLTPCKVCNGFISFK
jgi:hypothetical protein